jgi:hypothetical protein
VAKTKEPVNPFYILVVLIGVVFVITTFAYGTMAYRAVAQTEESPGLMSMLDEHGVSILSGELVVLGLVTFGAMWLDGVRTRRTELTTREHDIDPPATDTTAENLR